MFLAYTSDRKCLDLKSIHFELESFVYFKPWQLDLINQWDDFLLDSGAFTFINRAKKRGCTVDFGAFLSEYIKFINLHDIKSFFELDLDSVVGYEQVLLYRKRLESETGKRCIPVWHKNRGLKDWCKTVRQYNRVAIGGFAIKEIRKPEYHLINKYIKIAHRHGCKVHGLGFTNTRDLSGYDFDSVDSTSWKSGGRFGQMHSFDGQAIISKKLPRGNGISWKEIDAHNLNQWIKYQKYMAKGDKK